MIGPHPAIGLATRRRRIHTAILLAFVERQEATPRPARKAAPCHTAGSFGHLVPPRPRWQGYGERHEPEGQFAHLLPR